MENKHWKKEKQNLTEAYEAVVESGNHGNVKAALKDDEDADHYEKTGKIRKKVSKGEESQNAIMKKDLQDEEKELATEGTGSKDHEYDAPHRKADREKVSKDSAYQQKRKKMQDEYDDNKKGKDSEEDEDKPVKEGLGELGQSVDMVDEIPGAEPEEMLELQPDELTAEIQSLEDLILNPPADKVKEYARNGQLHVYIDMLKKKLEAAEAVRAVVRGEEE